MDSEKILYWEQFLSELKEEEITHLAIALDKHTGIIYANKFTKIWFNGEINPHVFRTNVKEGWVEQFIPVKTASGDIIYDVKNECLVIERHYGEIEVI